MNLQIGTYRKVKNFLMFTNNSGAVYKTMNIESGLIWLRDSLKQPKQKSFSKNQVNAMVK
jgi:hypothetical protein